MEASPPLEGKMALLGSLLHLACFGAPGDFIGERSCDRENEEHIFYFTAYSLGIGGELNEANTPDTKLFNRSGTVIKRFCSSLRAQEGCNRVISKRFDYLQSAESAYRQRKARRSAPS